MFFEQIGTQILEISHKRTERPLRDIYFKHIHSHCEMLLFITGQADYNIDGQIFKPSPYDVLIVPADTYHYLIPTPSIPYENYVIGLDPSFMTYEQYEKLFGKPMMFNLRDKPELYSYFTRLDNYHEHYSQRDFEICAECLIKELITYCYYHKHELTAVHSQTVSHIERIVTYINDNLQENLNAESISKELMLSKSYVQNIFSQEMHIGLKKFIMQKKIYAARTDLSKGLSPTQVCNKYAFADYSVFYRLYLKTFGISPKKSIKK